MIESIDYLTTTIRQASREHRARFGNVSTANTHILLPMGVARAMLAQMRECEKASDAILADRARRTSALGIVNLVLDLLEAADEDTGTGVSGADVIEALMAHVDAMYALTHRTPPTNEGEPE